jgi:predicted acyltransferase
MWLHALGRALLLVLLGVFLRSTGRAMTNWTFEDTLSQIGLGYPFLFALGFAGSKVRGSALVVIVAGYWAFFALHPLPPADFNRAAANIPKNWEHDFAGFAAHWNLNTNAAWAFDRWFLNLFPREKEFLGNPGGYSTLNFIPTLGTMLLGLIAGGWLQCGRDRWAREGGRVASTNPPGPPGAAAEDSVVSKMALAAVICLAAGWLLHTGGICPSVKKIWTPAWVLFSGGWCFLLMAAFYFVLDVLRWRAWAFPFVVIGMNSIAMYFMAHEFRGYIIEALRTNLGKDAFDGVAAILGLDPAVVEPTIAGALTILVLWLILFWMHRRKIYLRI